MGVVWSLRPRGVKGIHRYCKPIYISLYQVLKHIRSCLSSQCPVYTRKPLSRATPLPQTSKYHFGHKELMSSNVIYSRQNSTQAVTGVVKYHNIPKRQAREELPNHVNTYKTYIGVMWHEPILVSPTFNKITSKITSNAEIIRPTGVSICYASTSDILSAKYPNTR